MQNLSAVAASMPSLAATLNQWFDPSYVKPPKVLTTCQSFPLTKAFLSKESQ